MKNKEIALQILEAMKPTIENMEGREVFVLRGEQVHVVKEALEGMIVRQMIPVSETLRGKRSYGECEQRRKGKNQWHPVCPENLPGSKEKRN